jgi:DNA-binding MarR family transcriptional regulator
MEIEKIRLFREKLRVLEIEMGRPFEPDRDCCGLTFSRCHTLLEIGKQGDVSLGELASTFGLDASTLSRAINGLVQIGHVDRLPLAKDRRCVSIRLTGQGRKVFDEIEDTFNAYFGKVFEFIDADKRDSVLDSIILLADAIKQLHLAGRCCPEGEKS